MQTRRVVVVLLASICGAAIVSPLRAADTAPTPPNILIILADDMGFSDAGCFGGEIHTPNIDALAAGGLRFTQFYNTARCWPTRSALLTGYYAQQVRMDPPEGRLPGWSRLMPHYLKPLGYRCYHSGKWHIPGAPKQCADGGFDRSYSLDDHDHYFCPSQHTEDDRPLPPVAPNSGYYATAAIADRAIQFLREHAENHPGQPFFQYLAFISPHFPLQAPAEDIARYRDRYLVGWDAIRAERLQRMRAAGIVTCQLSDRQPQIVPGWNLSEADLQTRIGTGEVGRALAWTQLTDEQKQFQAGKMAIHAGMIDRMDREIGRVLDQVRAMHAFSNTIVFFLSDNGASAEQIIRGDGHDPSAPPGSAKTFLCLGPGWSTASNTPLKLHKTWVHEGGISTALVVHWPAGITGRGELRHDVGHVIDFVPTLLDVAGGKWNAAWNGVEAPPLPGRSLVPAFSRDGSVRREWLFFEHNGHGALREGDWKLVSLNPGKLPWELYNLTTDRCEKSDVAVAHPEEVARMAEKWRSLREEFKRQAGPATKP